MTFILHAHTCASSKTHVHTHSYPDDFFCLEAAIAASRDMAVKSAIPRSVF